jgi:hypothetical protein
MTNGITMTNAIIESIVSRSTTKYYDPAITLSDDQVRELVRIATTAGMNHGHRHGGGLELPQDDHKLSLLNRTRTLIGEHVGDPISAMAASMPASRGVDIETAPRRCRFRQASAAWCERPRRSRRHAREGDACVVGKVTRHLRSAMGREVVRAPAMTRHRVATMGLSGRTPMRTAMSIWSSTDWRSGLKAPCAP